MNIRQVDVSQADKASALAFFEHLFSLCDLEEARVLDAFARNGQLTVSSYYWKLSPEARQRLECWELSAQHIEALERYTHHVKIGCSYGFAKQVRNPLYDLIVIDTPQGLHRDARGNVHVEHFDFLPHAVRMLKNPGVLVLYVNKDPYDKNSLGSHGYDEYEEYDFKRWMLARQVFYRFTDTKEEFFVHSYRRVLQQLDWKISSMVMTPCFSDVPGRAPYSFRLGLCLEK